MKMDSNSLIGVFLLVLLLSIPIALGRVPAMPRKSGRGWTAPVSMRDAPQKFWTYEGTGTLVAVLIFGMSRLARISPMK